MRDAAFRFGAAGGEALPPLALALAHGLPYCGGVGEYGYYNNWFIADLRWCVGDLWFVLTHDTRWTDEPGPRDMVQAFDKSGIIFSRRANDLIFQTAAIRLYLAPEARVRMVDFSYQHHTTRHGSVNFGGLESGTRDAHAKRTLATYAKAHGGSPRPCDVVATAGGAPERLFIVNPSGSGAPACQEDGTMPFF